MSFFRRSNDQPSSFAAGSSARRLHARVIVQRLDRSVRGVHYQDYLSDASSRALLAAVRPALVLSGHDHDQCRAVHALPSDPAHRVSSEVAAERTVGTFSWLQGNPRPSFALLTLRGVERGGDGGEGRELGSDDAATALCYLPNQIWTFRAYGVFFALTAAALLVAPLARVVSALVASRGAGGRAFAAAVGAGKVKVEEDAGENTAGDTAGNTAAAGSRGGRARSPNDLGWGALGAALWRHCGPFVMVVATVVATWSALLLADLAAA